MWNTALARHIVAEKRDSANLGTFDHDLLVSVRLYRGRQPFHGMRSNALVRFAYVGPLRVASQIEEGAEGALIGTLRQIHWITLMEEAWRRGGGSLYV